jgi:hypothetical protein
MNLLDYRLTAPRLGRYHSKAPSGTAEQPSGGGGPGFEECSSIHWDSKQQRGKLLKPKILWLHCS